MEAAEQLKQLMQLFDKVIEFAKTRDFNMEVKIENTSFTENEFGKGFNIESITIKPLSKKPFEFTVREPVDLSSKKK